MRLHGVELIDSRLRGPAARLIGAHDERWLARQAVINLVGFAPLAIATLLIFVLMPDGFAVAKKTQGTSAPAAVAPAKH